MWVLLAFGSALFAGITAVLAKIGIKGVNSHLATALRTVVVAVFAWLMVLIVGSGGTIGDIRAGSWLFLVLSGPGHRGKLDLLFPGPPARQQ